MPFQTPASSLKIGGMKKLIFLILCTAVAATAQVRVVKSADRKLVIDLSGMRTAPDAASQTFFQTLEKDLRISGWFAPQRGTGELRLVGSVETSGGSVKTVCQVYRTGDQARLFSKSYSIDVAQVQTLAHRAADDIVETITGRKGIASVRIAMVGNMTGAKELYIMNAGGGGLMQITKDRKIVVGPNWGPDGDSILFTSYLRGFPDVYLADIRRGKRDILASYGGLNTGAALSPNSRELALILSKDGNPELYIKNLRSGQLKRLTTTGRATEASPCWSPDGRQIVYVSDQSGTPQLYVISSEGGRPVRISSSGTENVAPDWGPNGLIACASRSGGRYAIAVINPADRQTTFLRTDFADYEDPSWMPDGRHIVATRTVNYRSTLYLLDTVSDAPVALLNSDSDWYSPACAPQ